MNYYFRIGPYLLFVFSYGLYDANVSSCKRYFAKTFKYHKNLISNNFYHCYIIFFFLGSTILSIWNLKKNVLLFFLQLWNWRMRMKWWLILQVTGLLYCYLIGWLFNFGLNQISDESIFIFRVYWTASSDCLVSGSWTAQKSIVFLCMMQTIYSISK